MKHVFKLSLCLVASFVIVLNSSASITSGYTDMGNLSSTVLSLQKSLDLSAGDVVVMVGASNKRASVSLVTFTSTAGTFINLDANTQLGGDPAPNSYLSYLPITSSGTYNFVATSSAAQTGNIGIYTLSASSGVIQFKDADAQSYATVPVGASLPVSSYLNWGVNPLYGAAAVVGVGSSVRANISTASLTLNENNAGSRLAGIALLTGASDFTSIWNLTNTDTATGSASVVGAAFVEIVPVPEPSALALAGLGALCLRLTMRHRQ